MEEKKFCKYCGEKIDKSCVVCPKCGRQIEFAKENNKEKNEVSHREKEDKKIYEKDWFMWLTLIFIAPLGIFLMWKYNTKMKKNTKIVLSIVFGLLFIIAATSGNSSSTETDTNNRYESNKKVTIVVVDFSTMTSAEIDTWCNDKQIYCKISRDYSDTIEKDKFVSQSVESSKSIYQGGTIEIVYSLGKEPSMEYKNALKKAESYSDTMHMSKQGIYDQLTSEYGEQFPADAAQYAIDNMTADWNANALSKAKSYQETMNMSKQAIYDQLTSEYGEQFTKSEAQYAIDHLDE